ncbi:MAG: DNA replication/repair protein RecF [Bacteriovoracaceae bacterium]
MDLKLSKILVTHFRNLAPELLEFSPKVNCVFGQNGNGKTNLLEAIYYLTNRKSFRKNASFPQMLSIDGEDTEILFQALFLDQGLDQVSVAGRVKKDESTWYINQLISKKKLPLSSVFINPFDAGTFHTSTSFRREWFDYHLGLLDAEYKKGLNKYTKLLRMKNSLLSEKPKHYLAQIEALNLDLGLSMELITRKRQEFLSEIKGYYTKMFQELFSEKHDLEVLLVSKVLGRKASEITQMLQDNLQNELKIGHSTVGIHRDDFILHFDGLNSFDYCSLGQQKMAFLSLIFAYIELFRYKFMSYPLVLLDDVSGELDQIRWKNLIGFLKTKNFQVFITTANENFRHELESIDSAFKIHLSEGKVDKTEPK